MINWCLEYLIYFTSMRYFAFRVLRASFPVNNFGLQLLLWKSIILKHFKILADFSFRIGALGKKNPTIFQDFFTLQIWYSINLPWGHVRSHTKCRPDQFSHFDVYRLQTNRHTRHTYISYLDETHSEMGLSWIGHFIDMPIHRHRKICFLRSFKQ